jgi:hypothetical protein
MTMDVRWKDFRGKEVALAVGLAGASAVQTGAEFLLENANRTVPIDEGTLQRSGSVSVDESEKKAAVAYDTPYAARQHEDTRLRHDEGRRAKWLQQAAEENADQIRDLIAARLKAVLS